MNSLRPANTHSTTPQDTTALCLACGFCCNGVLHTYTRVAASEVEALQRLGTPLFPSQSGYEFAFNQPCPHWQDSRCAIYACRPKSCRTYECLLYKKLAAGLISPSEGLVCLQRAMDLRAQRDNSAAASEGIHSTDLLRSYLRRYFEPDSIAAPFTRRC